MPLAPEPKVVMLEATKTALRTARFSPAEVIDRQLDALAEAGYRITPHLDDGGAALLLTATRRAFLSGQLAPSTVVARQVAAIEAAGYAFVRRRAEMVACEAFQWGPQSFDSCAGCGLSFWRHAESAGHTGGAHRRPTKRR